jgi:branched-subunit amino acid ABC-type transport system permease component
VDLHQFIQLTVNGLINGSTYALLGVGFALILGVTGRFHFAYAFTYTLTGYLAAVAASSWGLPVIPAMLIGLLIGVVMGVVIEVGVYRPLAGKAGSNSLLVIFVASLGITIAGQSAITLIWGLNAQARTLEAFKISTWHLGSINFTNLDVLTVVVAWACTLAFSAFLRLSSHGRQIKAVRANPEMAQAVGIDSRAIYRVAFAIGSLFAGVAAILYTLKYAAVPDMGQRPVFYALVVAFIGGTARAPWKVGLTGLGLGLIESWSGNWVSAQWSSTIVFAVLLLYLTWQSLKSVAWMRPLRVQAQQS